MAPYGLSGVSQVPGGPEIPKWFEKDYLHPWHAVGLMRPLQAGACADTLSLAASTEIPAQKIV